MFTTPFTIEKYGALMLRPSSVLSFDVTSVSAGLDLRVYALILTFLLVNIVISLLNERVQRANDRNSIWHILLSLLPLNGAMFPKQNGITRKVLMATNGFAVLILSSLYLAKQAEELMIPNPLPAFTLRDIENEVASHRAKILIDHEASPILRYISRQTETLSNTLQSNPAIFASNIGGSKIEMINNYNGFYIDGENTLLYLLSKIEPNLCKNYLFITFGEGARMYNGIIVR